MTGTNGFQGDMLKVVLWALKSKQQTGQPNWIQLSLLQLEEKQLAERNGEAVVIQEVVVGGSFLSPDLQSDSLWHGEQDRGGLLQKWKPALLS